jgi:hypothetical protein
MDGLANGLLESPGRMMEFMGQSKRPTMSSHFPLLFVYNIRLNEAQLIEATMFSRVTDQTAHSILTQCLSVARKSFEQRFPTARSQVPYLVASRIDPRTKNLDCVPPVSAEKIGSLDDTRAQVFERMSHLNGIYIVQVGGQTRSARNDETF